MRSSALFLILVLVILQPLAAQTAGERKLPRREPSSAKEGQRRIPDQAEAKKLFSAIERNILNASLSGSTPQFAQQVFVNVSGGESGYFSANQTVSILQRYFSNRTSLSFQFSRYSDAGTMPYATGRLTFNAHGRRQSAQIYVSLRTQESRWVISQFNIY
ncbi:MAG TPA: DUF4783 domain-containing protein [Bacteroidota bacterium]|nr:DUF4783 domain-containing protein [Bacteroidota bacterium]